MGSYHSRSGPVARTGLAKHRLHVAPHAYKSIHHLILNSLCGAVTAIYYGHHWVNNQSLARDLSGGYRLGHAACYFFRRGFTGFESSTLWLRP